MTHSSLAGGTSGSGESAPARPRSTTTPLLHHRELGRNGPLIAFLPGVGGTTRYFESRVAPLATEYRLLLVDPLGFGRSPKPWVRYSVDRHVAELRRVLERRGPVTLVGHSFGAILAVAYAARFPDAVEGMVLIGLPHFGGEESALRYFGQRPGPDRWFFTHIGLAALACLVTRRLLGRVLPLLLPDLPREVAEDLVQHTWRSSTSTMWECVYRHDVALDAARLRPGLPVTLLHGALDLTAPLSGVERLVASHPRWSLQVFPEGNHHLFLQSAESCLEALRFVTTASRVKCPS